MENKLLELKPKFKEKKILVFGDFVLDQFLYGRISRISREAPVLILDYEKIVNLLGGGANAAHNIRSLGGTVFPAGLVGDDASGEQLLSLFEEQNINTSAIINVNGYTTPTKTRILAGSSHSAKQQIVRIDRGNTFQMSDPVQSQLIEKIGALLSSKPDAILVSDYGYRLNSDTIIEFLRRASKKENLPLIVDSRFDLVKYAHVTSMTPNISEVEEAYRTRIENDTDRLESTGMRILKEQKLDSLLITRGRHGMTLFESNKKPVHIPVFGGDEVADVTGAGDTVVATFTLALAAGASYYEAARLANYAGGIVVMKRGTATVSAEELWRAVESENQLDT